MAHLEAAPPAAPQHERLIPGLPGLPSRRDAEKTVKTLHEVSVALNAVDGLAPMFERKADRAGSMNWIWQRFAELGVVTHVHLAAGTAYHLADPAGATSGAHHVHAQCRSCRRVIDLPDGILDGVRRQLAASEGFALEPHHVALSGLCRDCADG